MTNPIEFASSVHHLPSLSRPYPHHRILAAIQQSLDTLEVRDRNFARMLCQWIPSTCPFARDLQLFGKTWIRIPPLCKLNPCYEQLMGLRFRALCYLVDECGEDIAEYSC